MKSQILKFGEGPRSLSPTAVFMLGLTYTIALGIIDYKTPVGMSFTLFYLVGTAFVGWGAGRLPAIGLAVTSAAMMLSQDRPMSIIGAQPAWVVAWNAGSHCLVLSGVGWLAADLSQFTRRLARLVDERTAQWKAEAESHKATSTRLREALDLNQKILEASAMGIVAYRASGECVFANEAIARITGGTTDQILQGNFRQLETWRSSGLLKLAEEALEQDRPRSGEIHGTTSFGKTVWVDAHMVPFVSGGKPHLLHLSYDITGRKTIERQILEISDREQARIGHEIHDGLCQQLVSLAFDANSLERELVQANLPASAIARRIADFLDQAITEARQLSRGLFPIRLETEGLNAALEELAHSTTERFRVECRFENHAPSPANTNAIATHLYRIAQEAVSNSIWHARAKTILIQFDSLPDRLELKVSDDGAGFRTLNPEEGNLSGMGLHIMDYRARSIGGTLRLGPGPSGGTIVSCCVPGRPR